MGCLVPSARRGATSYFGLCRPESRHFTQILRLRIITRRLPMILNVVVGPFLKTISGQRLFRGNINFPWFLGIAILIS